MDNCGTCQANLEKKQGKNEGKGSPECLCLLKQKEKPVNLYITKTDRDVCKNVEQNIQL